MKKATDYTDFTDFTRAFIRVIRGLLKRHPLLQEFLLAPLAMIPLFLVAFSQFVFGDRILSTFPDNTYLLQPIFHHLSQSFRRGDYPYWMDTILAGLPLYNSPQFSAEYPFYFFRFGLYSSPLAALVDTHHVLLLHFFILYLNTYVMLRVFRLAPIPALLGASLFAFSPVVVLSGFWVNILAPYSWFPLVVASVFLVLEDRRTRAGMLLGITSISLLTTASPSQPLIHSVFTVGILYIFYAVHYLKNREIHTLWRVTRNMLVVAMLAFAISSPSVAPALLSAKDMIRFLGEYPPIVGNAKIPFNAFLVGELRPSYLAAALFPLQITLVLGNPFVGIGAVLFALFALFRRRTDRIVLPMALLALWGLFSATGSHLGFAQLNYHLPLIDKIREPGRHLILFVFGVSTLAAFGLAYLIDVLKTGYRALFDIKHLPAILIFLGVLLASLNTKLSYIAPASSGWLLGVSGLTVGSLLTLRWVDGWKQSAVALAVALSIIYGILQYPITPPRWQDGDYFSTANLVSHKVLGALSNLQDVRSYRILFGDDKLSPAFWSMNASYYGLRTFQGYMNPLPYEQFESVLQRWDLPHYYPLLGAKYYLCNPCDQGLLRDYDFMTEIDGYQLNVARQALPRYTIMSRLAGSYGNQTEFMAKIEAGYDYTREFYVGDNDLGRVKGWLAEQSGSSPFVLKEESASLNHINLSVNTQDRAMFLLNEFFDRAWKARVNGVAVTPIRVNASQIGVLLEKGANLVEIEYRPALFIALLWLQRILILCLIAYMVCLIPLLGKGGARRGSVYFRTDLSGC